MEKEIWKDVIGWEGIYQISNYGRLKSFKVQPEGYILKQTDKNGWYFTVNLQKGDRFETKKIHRLVAFYFVDNPKNKPHVNHKDLNKQNNHYKNLEWVTQKDNNRHAKINKPWIHDGMVNYNQNVKPKAIIQYNLSGDFIAEFKNGNEASKHTGVCSRNILQVASCDEYKPGKTRKQAGGFIWKYKNHDKI